MRQKSAGGTLLAQTLSSQGIGPGIKEEMEAKLTGVTDSAHRREWHDD